MEWKARDLLEIASGEPPRLLPVPGVRRRAVRRRLVQVGSAAVAVALATVLGAGLSFGATGTHRPAGGATRGHAAPPPYYVVEVGGSRSSQQVFDVHATATGKVTAIVGNPSPGTQCGGNIVAADRQTFFVTCTTFRPASTSASPGPARRQQRYTSQTVVYRFHLTRSGKAAGFAPVKGTTIKNALVQNLAVAPDGSQVAFEVVRPGPNGQIYTNSVSAGIFVINTRTGHRAFWHTGPYVPGAIQYAGAGDISFTRDGGVLVVHESRCHRSRYRTNCPGQVQVRAYAPASQGGSLERGRVLVSSKLGSALFDALIDPAGSALNAVINHCPRRGTCTLSVVRISTVTGQVERVLYRVRTGTPFEGTFERLFSSDPTGRFLILDAGVGNARVNGWIDRGRLVPLVPANGNIPISEAW